MLGTARDSKACITIPLELPNRKGSSQGFRLTNHTGRAGPAGEGGIAFASIHKHASVDMQFGAGNVASLG